MGGHVSPSEHDQTSSAKLGTDTLTQVEGTGLLKEAVAIGWHHQPNKGIWDAQDVSCCLAVVQNLGNCGTSPTTPGQGLGVFVEEYSVQT